MVAVVALGGMISSIDSANLNGIVPGRGYRSAQVGTGHERQAKQV